MNKRGNLPEVQDSAPMEQVRELLFGAQLKDMETRMQRLDDRFKQSINDAKDDLKTRLDSLENFMKSEVNSLLNRVKEEQQEREDALKTAIRERNEAIQQEAKERSEAIKQLAKDLANANDNIDHRFTKLSSSLDSVERELRQLLLSESSSLTSKIEDKYNDALNVLAKTAQQIRSDMVYRTALSGIFTEAVVQLNSPWNSDGQSTEPEDIEP